MNISVVVPLFNEEESLPELVSWIDRVMHENHFSYEIIMVDDGSKDKSWQIIEELQSRFVQVKGIKFRRNYGKSAALFCGFDVAQGDVVITMDADLQDSPDEIPELYSMIIDGGFDLVSGWKKKRHDPVFTKNLPSKLYNWTVRRMSGIKLHDMNCGLKAYRKNVIKGIEVYGEMHRYLPTLAHWEGFRVSEIPVQHHARRYGKTKFGLSRFLKGFLDLLTLLFTTRYLKRPLHFFGTFGALFAITGLIIDSWLTVEWALGKTALSNRPLALLASTTRRPTAPAIRPPMTGPRAGPSRCAVCTMPMADAIRSRGADSAAIARHHPP